MTLREYWQADEFANIDGYRLSNGRIKTHWMLGPDAIASFGMNIDKVEVRVKNYALAITCSDEDAAVKTVTIEQGHWRPSQGLVKP